MNKPGREDDEKNDGIGQEGSQSAHHVQFEERIRLFDESPLPVQILEHQQEADQILRPAQKTLGIPVYCRSNSLFIHYYHFYK